MSWSNLMKNADDTIFYFTVLSSVIFPGIVALSLSNNDLLTSLDSLTLILVLISISFPSIFILWVANNLSKSANDHNQWSLNMRLEILEDMENPNLTKKHKDWLEKLSSQIETSAERWPLFDAGFQILLITVFTSFLFILFRFYLLSSLLFLNLFWEFLFFSNMNTALFLLIYYILTIIVFLYIAWLKRFIPKKITS